MLRVTNMYISRDNGVEERGADTGWSARGGDMVVTIQTWGVIGFSK